MYIEHSNFMPPLNELWNYEFKKPTWKIKLKAKIVWVGIIKLRLNACNKQLDLNILRSYMYILRTWQTQLAKAIHYMTEV